MPDSPRTAARFPAAGRLFALLAALLVSSLLATPDARAAEEAALDAAELAALLDQQRIDRATGAFASPLLIQLRARVSPRWPGPRGIPPVNERRHCPSIPVAAGVAPVVPGFC